MTVSISRHPLPPPYLPLPAEPAPGPRLTQGIEWLRGLDADQFEELLVDGYRRLGYQAPRQADAEPGPEVVELEYCERRILVQTRYWRTWHVSGAAVRELFGLVAAQGADGGVVVTSGGFGREAATLGHEYGLQLLDGPELLGLIAGERPVVDWQDLTPPRRARAPKPPLGGSNESTPATAGALNWLRLAVRR